MSIMNSFQRGFTTLVLIVLIVISLQSNHAAAGEVGCDLHFWADEGPNPRISCISFGDPDKDYQCKSHSCTVPAKRGRQSWEKLQFGPCHRSGHPPGQATHVKQYFRGLASASVQDKDGNWWECNYMKDGDHNNGAVCESLSAPPPDPESEFTN
ncbi:hypothetical protein PSTT_11212 [Puccinia striiformis]|uniref:Secreted protein n=1 Tax=Puccinia striiformis TaxID=27350 RepID=A0A2S4V1A5_9BASI|nr:hypothetical protein PSTT_11212 [Puccinia striiformis]